jgi:hypothetical protein
MPAASARKRSTGPDDRAHEKCPPEIFVATPVIDAAIIELQSEALKSTDQSEGLNIHKVWTPTPRIVDTSAIVRLASRGTTARSRLWTGLDCTALHFTALDCMRWTACGPAPACSCGDPTGDGFEVIHYIIIIVMIVVIVLDGLTREKRII